MAENNNSQTRSTVSVGDLLALERTKLANERTLLAYIRTSLAALAAALSLTQFFENRIYVMIGYFFIPVGLLLLIIGLTRYSNSKKVINGMIFPNTKEN